MYVELIVGDIIYREVGDLFKYMIFRKFYREEERKEVEELFISEYVMVIKLS